MSGLGVCYDNELLIGTNYGEIIKFDPKIEYLKKMEKFLKTV